MIESGSCESDLPMTETPRDRLEARLAEELGQTSIPEAHRLSDEIRRRHGDTVAAVVFYGSCLRKRDAAGGVLDFYVLVDDYACAYSSKWMAVANAWLPPNVFLMQVGDGEDALRAKYAVMTCEDFAKAALPESSHSIVWSRFCQPARIVWARDEDARRGVVAAAAEAVLTMIRASLAVVDAAEDGIRIFTAESLWQTGFGRTYGTELRTESVDTIRQLFDADPGRYDEVTRSALEVLAGTGEVSLCGLADGDGAQSVRMSAEVEKAMLDGWRRRAGPVKALYGVRLVKSAFTFGDWLPYALWKLNRHTGVEIEPTPLQRRHPFLFGWPVILRLLLSQKLR
jgi:hypothetical protein